MVPELEAYVSKVFLPGSNGYNASVASYFSPQAAALMPACFVAPYTAHDIAVAVKSLTSAAGGGSVDFAIRAGGHQWFSGANNSPGSVTIDLCGLNTIDVSHDKASVSVGGLTLGGGISYFGPREGWTCNQAIGFEVVLADGSIVEASETERPDLWKALRGTSNNFGVVTKIKYRTFEQGLLWYTMTFNTLSVINDQAAIYAGLMSPEKYDLIYTRVDANITKAQATPPYYQPVVNLPSIPVANLDGVVVAIMSTLAATAALVQISQASQYLSTTVTFQPTEVMIKETFAAFNKSLTQAKEIKDVSWVVNLEALPPQIYQAQGGSGASALGITGGRSSRSLVVCLLSVGWPVAAQNQQVYDAARGLIDDIDVMASYGAESVAELRRVRDKYDPKHVFTRQVSGGFKIPEKAC
ncbi:putative oxidoreductase [Xylariaceae sp. FL1272]|nr:putative oxidoreductase [Xylariaceae sp. FL1272]